MNVEDRKEIMNAINKAIETFEKALEDWEFNPPIKIEVAELYSTFDLGERIVVDKIKEYENREKTKNKEE